MVKRNGREIEAALEQERANKQRRKRAETESRRERRENMREEKRKKEIHSAVALHTPRPFPP